MTTGRVHCQAVSWLGRRRGPFGGWVLAIGAATSLHLFSQPPVGWWGLSGIALVPWFTLLHGETNLRAALLGSGCVGLAVGCAAAPWLPTALQDLGSHAANGILGLVLASLWAKALPFAGIGWILYISRGWSVGVRTLTAGVAFAAYSWIALSTAWGVPWALLGYGAGPGLSQLTVVAGVGLPGALLASTAWALASALAERTRRAARLAMVLTVTWLSVEALGMPLAKLVRPDALPDPVRIVVVQPNLPRGERWDSSLQQIHVRRVGTFTDKELKQLDHEPDAVIWPENLVTSAIDSDPDLEQAMQRWVDALGVDVITGAVRASEGNAPGRYRSSVLWFAPGRGVVAGIDKARAIPVLESASEPLGYEYLEGAFGRAATLPKVEESSELGPLSGSFVATPLLCYEALFPRIARARWTPESVAILNLADDSWVSGERATRQLTAFAAFRAIELRLPLIRVAHGGLSAVIDEFGQTQVELPLDTYASTVVEVSRRAPPKWGERFAIASLPLAVGLSVWWATGSWIRSRSWPWGSRG